MILLITLVTVLHILACIVLIVIVLLQAGKGADMGASFGGGGNQTLFGTSGATTILSKITTGVAILFMLTSLFLAYQSGHRVKSTVMHSVMANAKPAAEKEAPKEPAPAAPVSVPAAPITSEKSTQDTSKTGSTK